MSWWKFIRLLVFCNTVVVVVRLVGLFDLNYGLMLMVGMLFGLAGTGADVSHELASSCSSRSLAAGSNATIPGLYRARSDQTVTQPGRSRHRAPSAPAP